MRVSAPPFVAACYYGTDIDDPAKINANQHTIPEIAKIIGVDSLGYLPLEALPELAGSSELCSACFDGRYPTAIPEHIEKDRFEVKLSKRSK